MTCAAAALALAVSVLAGCSGGDPAPPQTSAPASSPTTSTTSMTTSAPPTTSTTSAGPNFPAGLPDAAKTKNKAGAEAFVRYFVKQLNSSWRAPDSSLLVPLCQSSSKACSAHIETADKFTANRERYRSDAIALAKVQDLGSVDGRPRLLVNINVLGASVVRQAGGVVRTDKASAVKNVFLLAWGDAGWQVAEIRNV